MADEQLYTLPDAQRELNRRECARKQHSPETLGCEGTSGRCDCGEFYWERRAVRDFCAVCRGRGRIDEPLGQSQGFRSVPCPNGPHVPRELPTAARYAVVLD